MVTDRRGSTARATYTHPLSCWARHPIRSYVIIWQFKRKLRTASIVASSRLSELFTVKDDKLVSNVFPFCAVFISTMLVCALRWWEYLEYLSAYELVGVKNSNWRTLLWNVILMMSSCIFCLIQWNDICAKHRVSFHCYHYKYFRKCLPIIN